MRLREGALFFILLLLTIVSQAQKLNYVRKNVSLPKLFREIRKQTGVSVVWNENDFNANQYIDADFRNAELKKVMDEVSAKLSLSYTLLDKMIVVKDKKFIAAVPPVRTEKAKVEEPPMVSGAKNGVLLDQVEIVSTGYQRIPRERATGSFMLVDSAQLNRKVSGDILSRLEGITSGLLFNKNTLSSSVGSLDVSIRGRSTIYANDQPLIILDNFPFNGDFNSINPNDVANITILKDAAAASIWGVRAGNGVIVITTRKGKYSQPLALSFNSNVTFSGKPDVFYDPNYLSSSDFIDIETFLFNQGKYDADLLDKTNYPVVSPVVRILDKQRNGQSSEVTEAQLNALRRNDIRNEELKYFYRNQVAQQYFLNMSKGTEKSSHYLSVGYDRSLLNLVNNEDNRITVNTQHSIKLLKNLELNTGLSYVGTTGKMDSTITSTSGLNSTPYYQFKDADGKAAVFERFSKDFNAHALTKGFLDWSFVPLDELNQPPIDLKGNDLRLNAGLKYTLVPGLSAELKYQYQRISSKSERVRGVDAYFTRDMINQYSVLNAGQVSSYPVPKGAIQSLAVMKAASKNLRGQLNYQKDWKRHTVSAIAGYEFAEFESDANQYTYYGYDPKTGRSATVDTVSTFNLNPSGTGKISTQADLFGKLDRIRSVFANIGYTYDGKYTLSGSARIDGSNYFGVKTNQKNVPLWSSGALWHLDREGFYKLSWLPVLKLRATYGYNGNLDKNSTGITTFTYQGSAGLTGLPYATIANIGNPELKWEKIGIANFGLDFGSKGQVITGRLEYYFKKGTDMLGDKAFASSTGINLLRGNYSEMKSSGVDISITTQNLKGSFRWQTNFLFSTVQDKVTRYDYFEPDNTFYVGEYNIKPVLGKPVYGIYSYKWAGLDPLSGDPRGYLNGEISKDYTAIVNETELTDLEYDGPARPTVFGGLNNTISFRKFTLGFNVSYKFGYYFRKSSVNYYGMYHQSLVNINKDFTQRWQKSGDENVTDVPSMGKYTDDGTRDKFYNGSSATVAKGDHIRLQDISLGFDLDGSIWKSIPVKQLQLYLYATNLGMIWKANDFGLDPDFVSVNAGGLANGLSKSFSFGIKASF